VHGTASNVAFAIVENGLTYVVFGTVAFSLLMSVLFLLTRGSESMYDQIGAGGLTPESDQSAGAWAQVPDSEASRAERDEEIRQMLQARSDRGVARGEPPLDVDAEMQRLLSAERAQRVHDPGLTDEVRQLVLARNERRVRKGLEPVDVDAEIARTLQELDP
jgi:hypothetical protein